jgi:hypothetical protein
LCVAPLYARIHIVIDFFFIDVPIRTISSHQSLLHQAS